LVDFSSSRFLFFFKSPRAWGSIAGEQAWGSIAGDEAKRSGVRKKEQGEEGIACPGQGVATDLTALIDFSNSGFLFFFLAHHRGRDALSCDGKEQREETNKQGRDEAKSKGKALLFALGFLSPSLSKGLVGLDLCRLLG
jgi:hypothetical protein